MSQETKRTGNATREDGGEWAGDDDILADPAERQHLFSVLDSFRQYRRAAHFHTTHVRRQSFYALPSPHISLLSQAPISYLDTLAQIDDAIDTNADIAEMIVESGAIAMGVAPSSIDYSNPPWKSYATKLDLDKARSTMHQLYRDWSEQGNAERQACYGPVLRGLDGMFSAEQKQTGVNVLVPGAGLGRLVYELAALGYHAQGNEISYHQLLTSSFILNHTSKVEQYRLHPFVLSFANVRRREDQMREIRIPDVNPGASMLPGSMSMTTGDFSTTYRDEHNKEAFDAVVTVFFIDTAKNVIEYIETVRHCLRKGGVWINLGPLLWHFGNPDTTHKHTDDPSGSSAHDRENEESYGGFELCDEEVVQLVERFGFTVELHEPECGQTGYVQNPSSMLQSIYRPSHWIARKD